MTNQNSLKRLIRRRMSKTGESYSTARKAILKDAGSADRQPAEKLKVVLAQPSSRSGDLETDLDSLFANADMPPCDVLVLPELIGGSGDPIAYESTICQLAKKLRCHVVGGSCYVPSDRALINSGIVASPQGTVVSRYEKARPYGSELGTGVAAGSKVGRFRLAGREFAVLICSDLWFSDSFSSLQDIPDTVLIPSFSVHELLKQVL